MSVFFALDTWLHAFDRDLLFPCDVTGGCVRHCVSEGGETSSIFLYISWCRRLLSHGARCVAPPITSPPRPTPLVPFIASSLSSRVTSQHRCTRTTVTIAGRARQDQVAGKHFLGAHPREDPLAGRGLRTPDPRQAPLARQLLVGGHVRRRERTAVSVVRHLTHHHEHWFER